MEFDAIIIGAGPAGASAAIALSQQGRRVAIIERSVFPRRKVCGEFMSAVNMALLERLGAGERVRELAGPEVMRVALFGAGPAIVAGMPKARGEAFGRALGRDVLDGVMVEVAQRAGAVVLQPWRAVDIVRDGERSRVVIESGDERRNLSAPVVIAAHGSWEQGRLTSNLEKRHGPKDFLGFKAHFSGATLASDLMPLLAFPGGYGGMVWADQGRLSLSCCVRRDALTAIRQRLGGGSAGAAVEAHIRASCPAVADALEGAVLEGEWLAAGPIRPAMRAVYADDIFRVGNVAGESHPIIAEGISMALQSGWMLAQELGREPVWDIAGRERAGARFGKAWRRQFSTRIRLASVLAQLAVMPRTADMMGVVVGAFPGALSMGARLSGKTKRLAM